MNKPEGIESGIAIIEDMRARGEVDDRAAERMRHEHLAAMYDLGPCDCEACSTSARKP